MYRLNRVWARVRISPALFPQTQEDRNAQAFCLNTAMMGVSFGGIAAFMGVFLARLGVSSKQMGWYSSAPALLMMFFVIPGAVLSERFGNHVRVRVIAAYIGRTAYLLCAVLPFFVPQAYLPPILIAVWALKTLPDAVAIPAWTSVMVRAISPARRARLNGTRWALLSLVSALSSALFGWLLDQIAFPLNYQLVFLISYVASMLDPLFFSRVRVPEALRPVVDRSKGLGQRMLEYIRPVVRYRPFLVFLAATMLYRIALNVPAPLFSLYWVNQLDAADTLLGLRGTVANVALMVGYLWWGRAAERMGHLRILVICALSLGLYPILTALAPSAGWLLPVAGLWGLAAAGVDVGLFDLMLASCPGERQPLFGGFWSMAVNVAMFVGPQLGAWISGQRSLMVALILAGGLQMIATIPFVKLPRDV